MINEPKFMNILHMIKTADAVNSLFTENFSVNPVLLHIHYNNYLIFIQPIRNPTSIKINRQTGFNHSHQHKQIYLLSSSEIYVASREENVSHNENKRKFQDY